jgi:hypothetical protein
MKFFIKKNYGLKSFQILTVILLISIAVAGSDCEKTLLNTNPNVPQEMLGNWIMIEQTGALQDICEGETINFLSNGVAELKCPNQSILSRNFSVENDVLTYTQTNIAYNIESLTSDTLYLLGQNVSRNLRYLKIKAETGKNNISNGTEFHNSSEVRR